MRLAAFPGPGDGITGRGVNDRGREEIVSHGYLQGSGRAAAGATAVNVDAAPEAGAAVRVSRTEGLHAGGQTCEADQERQGSLHALTDTANGDWFLYGNRYCVFFSGAWAHRPQGLQWMEVSLSSDPSAEYGAVAQLGERLDRTQEARGSSPLSSIPSPLRRAQDKVGAPWCNWQHACLWIR